MDYYAHVSDDGRRQTVAEHLTGTAALCRAFAGAFGEEADGELMGLAHDLGKCTDGFQNRLLRAVKVSLYVKVKTLVKILLCEHQKILIADNTRIVHKYIDASVGIRHELEHFLNLIKV